MDDLLVDRTPVEADVGERPPVLVGALPVVRQGWEEAVKALSGREVRITTANVVLLKGEGATWGEALQRGPWSVAGVLGPKEL